MYLARAPKRAVQQRGNELATWCAGREGTEPRNRHEPSPSVRVDRLWKFSYQPLRAMEFPVLIGPRSSSNVIDRLVPTAVSILSGDRYETSY